MTTAEEYRKRHLDLKNRKSEWPQIIFESLALLVSIGIILAVCILAVPKM